MKRVLFMGSLIFFIGCATHDNVATSVAQLAGNIKVAGWEGMDEEEKKEKEASKKIFSPSKKHYPVDSDADGVVDYMDRCPNTPIGVKVNHYGCKLLATLRLNFDYKSTKVKKEYYEKLRKLAKFLKKHPDVKIEIDGYTDNVGSSEYNLRLSKKRAEAVKEILVNEFLIRPSRIIVKGFGEKYPLAPNTTPESRALNRRVEIVAIGKDSKFLNVNL